MGNNTLQTNGEPLPNTEADHFTDPGFQRWIRLPRGTDPCPHSGLRRSALQNLAYSNRGAIRVLNLREPGAKKGAVLIWLPSLLTYLHKQASEQEAQELTADQLAALPGAKA